MIGFTRSDQSRPPRGRKASPRKMRGFCIFRLFDEQRVLFGYGFPIGLTPPKIAAQHTMPTCILQQLTASAWADSGGV
jgi:hypothetical protein